jgi:hypothetical protein
MGARRDTLLRDGYQLMSYLDNFSNFLKRQAFALVSYSSLFAMRKGWKASRNAAKMRRESRDKTSQKSETDYAGDSIRGNNCCECAPLRGIS